jgi:hypothetical protein
MNEVFGEPQTGHAQSGKSVSHGVGSFASSKRWEHKPHCHVFMPYLPMIFLFNYRNRERIPGDEKAFLQGRQFNLYLLDRFLDKLLKGLVIGL